MALIIEDRDLLFSSIKWAYRVGSIDERKGEYGSCHFLEHLFFKHKNQEKQSIANLIEDCGGTVNATTSHEKMIIHIQCPNEFTNSVLDFMYDMHKNFNISADDFKDEKKVILEEISRLEDNPSSNCGRKIFESFFMDTPYAHPILGSKQDIEDIRISTVVAFFERHFTDEKLLVSIVKNSSIDIIGEDRLMGSVEKRQPLINNMSKKKKTNICFIESGEVDAKAFLLFSAPESFSKEAAHLELWSYLFTKDESALLNKACMNSNGLIRGINMQLQPFEGKSMLEISVCYEPGKLHDVFSILAEAFKDVYVSALDLSFSSQLIKKQSIEENQDLDIVCMKNLEKLYSGNEDLEQNYLNNIIMVDYVTFESTLKQTLSGKPDAIVIESTLADSSVEFNDWPIGLTWKQGELEPLSLSENVAERSSVNFFIRSLKSKIIYLTSSSLGGNLYEFTENYQKDFFHYLSQSLFLQSSENSSDIIAKHLNKLGAQVSGFSGKDSFGFCASFFEEDLREIEKILAELLHNPSLNQSYLDMLFKAKKTERRFLEKNPKKYALTRSRELYFGHHPYGNPTHKTESLLVGELEHSYQLYLNEHANFSLCLSASMDIESLKIGPLHKHSYRPDVSQILSGREGEIRHEFDCEQVHIVYLLPGARWNTKQQVLIDLLCEVMAGQSGLLFETFRERYPICYEVAPICSHGYLEGVFGFYFATKRQNVEMLRTTLNDLISGLSEHITEYDLQKACASIMFDEQIQKQFLFERVMSASLMYTYGELKNPLGLYVENLDKITIGDLKSFIEVIFSSDAFVFELGPLNT